MAVLPTLTPLTPVRGRRFPDVSKTFWGFYDIVEATSEHTYTFDSELLHEKWN